MRIAIIGSGNVGKALGSAWARRGHEIHFGVRNPADAKHQALKQKNVVGIQTNREAALASEVVVLCTPWPETESALTACGDLTGKFVIDCTNPLTSDYSGLEYGNTSSGLEMVASWARGAQTFKALNQIGSNKMDEPGFKDGKAVMFVCGDGSGKSTVLQLVSELGFDAVDAGGVKIARLLEPFALLWIHLALNQGLGRSIGFSLLRK